MGNEDKAKQTAEVVDEAELLRRRDFLKGLKKWSQIVIGGIVLGGLSPHKTEAGSAWVNSRGGGGGGGWVNGGGGGGGGWVNRGGGGGGGWVNTRGGGGGGWVNTRGGGGGGWINTR